MFRRWSGSASTILTHCYWTTATANTSSTSATSQWSPVWCLHMYLDFHTYSQIKPLVFHFRVLLRVRMLYYLKQEVIGEHADSVLKGADIRYLMQLSNQAHTHTHLHVHLGLLSIPSGAQSYIWTISRDLDIWMPEMEQQEVPARWWDTEADRSLLAGVFKHGLSLSEDVVVGVK